MMTLEEEREAILAATGGAGIAEYCRAFRARHKVAGLCAECSEPCATGACPICEKPHIAGIYCLKHKLRHIRRNLHRYAGLRNI